MTTVSPDRSLILLLGGAPPTDVGIAGRPGMLWSYRARQQYLRRDGTPSGFDVVAYSPVFHEPKGWKDRNRTIPYWGEGEGCCRLSYRDFAVDFWNLVLLHHPVAVMSFSQAGNGCGWSLDLFPRNLLSPTSISTSAIAPRWRTRESYYDHAGILAHAELAAPYIGGGPGDPSPAPKSEHIRKGEPVDNYQPALNARRNSLPVVDLLHDLQRHQDAVRPAIHSGPMNGDVSELIAYHVSWYKDFADFYGLAPCRGAGHTSVGAQIDVASAGQALQIQLDALVCSSVLTEGSPNPSR